MSHRLPVLLALAWCGIAVGEAADPPKRVARLSYAQGEVFLQSAASMQALEPAVLNWPVTFQDRLVTKSQSRAELTLGTAALRVGDGTDMRIMALDENDVDIKLDSGVIILQVREFVSDERFVVTAPNSKLRVLQPGNYRVEASKNGTNFVAVQTKQGEAEVSTALTRFQQRGGEEARIGVDHMVEIKAWQDPDELDRWSAQRERHQAQFTSSRHVASTVVGHEDLNEHGAWQWEPALGMVWTPTKVDAGWAPYRSGKWVWIPPWGWTWVDKAPWGFAPFHYGRWAHVRERWVWVPGPRQVPATYAPALVVWVENSAEGNPVQREQIGWLPLGPRERYVPTYPASPGYVNSLNLFTRTLASKRSEAQSVSQAGVSHMNLRVPDAITWMPRQALLALAVPTRR